jgi:hypothetical protein
MINQIIAQVEESDRNIYLTIEDGSLVSVSYSQGLGDIDLHFLTTHNQGITSFVIRELEKQGDDLYSPEWFFPSPYWDEQVKVIDNAIWSLLKMENLKAELIERIEKLEKEIDTYKAQIKIVEDSYGI